MARRISSLDTVMVFGSPVSRLRPFISVYRVSLRGKAVPMFIFKQLGGALAL